MSVVFSSALNPSLMALARLLTQVDDVILEHCGLVHLHCHTLISSLFLCASWNEVTDLGEGPRNEHIAQGRLPTCSIANDYDLP